MLDPKLLRADLDQVVTELARRNFEAPQAEYQRLEDTRRSVQLRAEELRQERNTRSKNIGKAKAAGEDIEPLLKDVENLGTELDAANAELAEVQAANIPEWMSKAIATYQVIPVAA